jgi:pectate lyase
VLQVDGDPAPTDLHRRCHFERHDKTMLIGADPTHVGDRCIRVTIHHCFFDGTRQRHPRLRFGKVHLYNNYTRGWGIYAVCASVEAQIVSQCNIYEAGDGPRKKTTVFEYMPEKAADRDDVVAGCIRSEGDAFLNGALPCLIDGAGGVFRPEEYYQRWTMEPASPALKEVVQLCAGWQPVPRPPDTRLDSSAGTAFAS